jgi:hypothetical protein
VNFDRVRCEAYEENALVLNDHESLMYQLTTARNAAFSPMPHLLLHAFNDEYFGTYLQRDSGK